MNKEERKKLQDYLNYLQDTYEIGNSEDDFYSEEEDEWPDEFDIQSISLDFPYEYDHPCYPIEEFMDYMSDIESLVEIDKTTVRTNHIRQTIIDSRYKDWDMFREKISSYKFKGTGFHVSIKIDPILIGIINTKNENYDDDYGVGCCSNYVALELKYDGDDRLSKEQEDDLLERITFYLTREIDTAINISEVINLDEIGDYYLFDDEIVETTVNVDDLIGNSQLIKLYKQAKSTDDHEIKFLQYYKILEYISPLVAKLNAYDKLNKRLDLLASSTRDYKYLESIFSVTRKYDLDVKDDYLAESVIKTCVDVSPLWELIPERLQKQMKKSFLSGKSEINIDELKEEQLGSLQKQIAKMLYATRNSIVHAKSNYEPNGYELEGDELINGNRMMDVVALSVIQWNERQPESFRI